MTEARVAKDSHNSGKPPRSDGLGRKTRSLRRKSGKKPGGQLGHRGETLRLVAAPDELVAHRPGVCAHCQSALGRDAARLSRERRQVSDCPWYACRSGSIRRCIVRCPTCQQVRAGVFPAAAPSRAQYGPRLRALAVYLVEQQLVPYHRVRALLGGPLGRARLAGHTGAVGAGGADWRLSRWNTDSGGAAGERGCCTAMKPGCAARAAGVGARGEHEQLTHYAIHARRGSEATKPLGFCPTMRESACMTAGRPIACQHECRHALCNIHHLRELTFLEEQYQPGLGERAQRVAAEMKAATEQARSQGAWANSRCYAQKLRGAL